MRLGCAFTPVLFLLVILIAGGIAWLATRGVGPHYANGAYTVSAGDGQLRTDRISLDAARRFAAKLSPSLSLQSLAGLQRNGVDFTEEEVNSAVAQQLLASPIAANGLSVERVFVELHSGRSTAYVYGSAAGVPVTLSAGVTFSVANGTARVVLHDPKAGRLPIGVVLPVALDWSGNTDRLEQLLSETLPRQVTAIEPREGALHVSVNLAA